MARKVITTFVDDIDGDPIEDGNGETVKFALDGVNYEIDLTAANAEKLRDSLGVYVSHGRRAGRAAARPASSRAGREDLSAVREWLRSHGHTVSTRGRIPGELMSLYRNSSGR